MHKGSRISRIILSILTDPSALLVAPVVLAVSYFVWGGCITTLCCFSAAADCSNACGIPGGLDLNEEPIQRPESPFLNPDHLLGLDSSQELTNEMCAIKY